MFSLGFGLPVYVLQAVAVGVMVVVVAVVGKEVVISVDKR